jgi:formylglycine-generating enzyme required for sulfatase activity
MSIRLVPGFLFLALSLSLGATVGCGDDDKLDRAFDDIRFEDEDESSASNRKSPNAGDTKEVTAQPLPVASNRKSPNAGDTKEVTPQPLPVFEMVKVPEGTFEMGSRTGRRGSVDWDNNPQHTVTLSEGFHIAKTEVTEALYKAVKGDNPSLKWGKTYCATCPVVEVSWYEAIKFCNALSELEDLKLAYDISGETVTTNEGAGGYRLPTEAEWEYAARAGESHTYAGSDDLDEVAWHSDNSDSQTHPVGTKAANAWGIHDMTGNVSEWTGDRYGDYPTGSVTNPQGASTGDERVTRGGSHHLEANAAEPEMQMHSTVRRRGDSPDHAGFNLGFRIVRNAK